MPIPLAVPLIMAGTQALAGGIQAGIGAKKLKKLERPEYQIPTEIAKNLSEAELQALEGLPAEQKAQYIQNVERAGAGALSGMSSRIGGLTGLTDIVQSQSDAFTQLISMDAEARMRNRMRAADERREMAAYKDKQFDINQMQPYQEGVEEAQGLIGAGMQNIFSGLDTAAMAAMGGMGGGYAGGGGGDATRNTTTSPNKRRSLFSRIKGRRFGNDVNYQYYGTTPESQTNIG